MSITSWLYLGILIAGILLLICYHRAGKLLKCISFTAFTGVGALAVIWGLSRFIDIPIAVTPLSLLVSGVLGIPGVVGMLLLQLI